MAVFDVLTTTASDLRLAYQAGTIKVEDVVRLYFSQIDRCNHYLRAVIVAAPRELTLQRAKLLDKERTDGKIRGPLHGIPVVVKDNTATDPNLGMETTAGTFALVGSRVSIVSPATIHLHNAGAIIIAKANLSELSNFRGLHMPCGWSAVGGLTQSPYVSGGKRWDDGFGGHSSAGGSSSGSCVAVAAGFAPVALGTETNASIMMPATRNDVYSLKPTLRLISQEGVCPISLDFDTIGPIARCASDIAILLDAMVDRSLVEYIPREGYTSFITNSFERIRIGYLVPEEWHLSTSIALQNSAFTAQIDRETWAAYTKLRQIGADVKEVRVASPSELQVDGASLISKVIDARFKQTMNDHLQSLEVSKVRTLDGLMQFMRENAEQELPAESPNLTRLETAAKSDMSDEQYQDTLRQLRTWGQKRAVDKCLEDFGVDVIIGPADSKIHELSTAAGYPIATLPLSYADFNGRPFGLAAVTSAYQEGIIIHLMSAWEQVFNQQRRIPTYLIGPR